MGGIDADDDRETAIESPIWHVARESKDIDCLVIGSGTAGVTTAVSLAEHGLRVVILEAGPLRLLSHIANARLATAGGLAARLSKSATISGVWSNTERAGSGAPGWSVPTWVAVGGRTLYWSGNTPRYQPWDFDDWPIDVGAMSGFYDQAESLIKVSAAGDAQRPPFFQSASQSRFIEQLVAAGWPARPTPTAIDTGTDRGLGAGFDSSTSRLLSCQHLGNFADGALVSLVASAVATRMLLEGDRLGGVEVLDRRTGSRVVVHPRHVVLAGGAVQSTRLALSSGFDALNPLIGCYISDHLFLEAQVEFGGPRPDGPLNMLIDSAPQRPFQLQVQGCMDTSSYYESPSGESSSNAALVTLAAFGAGSARRENRIVLTGDGDHTYGGMQNMRVMYDRSPDDDKCLEAMQQGAAQAVAAFGAGLHTTQIHPPGVALHEVGGLRMGPDQRSGVTDTYGQFWQVQNLSAADASVFPSQGAANPYLSITAWSLRHADALARRLAGRSSGPARPSCPQHVK